MKHQPQPRRTQPIRWAVLPLLLLLLLPAGGCFVLLPNDGGAVAEFDPPRVVRPSDVALPGGYRIDAIATGLTYPSAVLTDDDGRVYVVEAGYSYGEEWAVPRLLRIERDGSTSVVASGDNPPWTGAVFHDGAFYLAEGGLLEGGRVVRVSPDGRVTPLVENIPTLGDHHTNGPAVGPDGKVYFAAGTATNSAVVGLDNYDYGWLPRFPDFHDVPARDVVLAGRNYVTPNPLTEDPGDEAVTGAYMPFGRPSKPGEVVPGRLPANGAVMRVPAGGGDVELVAWGLRNPYGLGFSPDGRLLVTENQFDVRGSRPVWGTGDLVWEIDWRNPGLWHGWPDYYGDQPLTDRDWFRPPGKSAPRFVLAEHPNPPPKPVAKLGVHAGAGGVAFPPTDTFGFAGRAFVAQFGDMSPKVGKVLGPVGFNVVMVDPRTGVVTPFAANIGPVSGPASLVGGGGLERPVGVAFSPDGRHLYVADFGVMTIHDGKILPRRGTGVVWRISREGL